MIYHAKGLISIRRELGKLNHTIFIRIRLFFFRRSLHVYLQFKFTEICVTAFFYIFPTIKVACSYGKLCMKTLSESCLNQDLVKLIEMIKNHKGEEPDYEMV